MEVASYHMSSKEWPEKLEEGEPEAFVPLLFPALVLLLIFLNELRDVRKLRDISLTHVGKTFVDVLKYVLVLALLTFIELKFLMPSPDMVVPVFFVFAISLMLFFILLARLIRLPLVTIGYFLHRAEDLGDMISDDGAREVGTVRGGYQPQKKRVSPIWKRKD